MNLQTHKTALTKRTKNECFYPLVFTGKEKDSPSTCPKSEGLFGSRLTSPQDLLTKYYNFGARYYDSDLSGLFLSVDPMADKYPSLSPYAYCAWNPVKLVDPNGKDGICVVNGKSLSVSVIINYSQKEMDNYLKQIDYDNPNAFKNDFCNYYQSAKGTYTIDGKEYDISFNIIFNNIDGIEDFKAERGSMFLRFDMENNNSTYKDNVIKMGNSPRFDYEHADFGGTFSHEIIHGLEIPDTKESSSGRLSSYSLNRSLQPDEITDILMPCVQLINNNGIENGRVLIPENNRSSNNQNSRSKPVILE